MGTFANLSGGTHFVFVSPKVDRTMEEVRAVIDREITARMSAGPFRAGNVVRAELYSDTAREDRLLLILAIDIGTSPSLREALSAVEKVAKIRVLASTNPA